MAPIFFRVDGNNTIATGHIVRCLSIARAICDREIIFVVSDDNSLSILYNNLFEEESYKTIVLRNDYSSINDEIPLLLKMLFPYDVSNKPWFFVDSYFVNESYFTELSQYFKIAYIDDLKSFNCPVDLLINYDTEGTCPYYSSAREVLLGASYTPLRNQFSNPIYSVSKEVKNILITSGGTDPYMIAKSLLDYILNSNDKELMTINYNILTSKLNSSFEHLSKLANVNKNIHIYESITNVVDLMQKNDLAISAGGTTLCELACVGVPTIGYTFADNQLPLVKIMFERDLISYVGDARTTNVIIPIINQIKTIVTDYNYRKRKSKQLRSYIDGKGAYRIAQKLN